MSNSRGSITESPWYWVYLFCTAGLIALLLVGPKYAVRQSHIERSAQGRQRAAQSVRGQETVAPMPVDDDTRISLRPLYFVLGGLLALAWANLLWRRFGTGRADPTVSEPLPHQSR